VLYYYRKVEGAIPEVVSDLGPDVWIQAEQPSKEELDRLASELPLERDLLQDAMDPNEVPRIQEEEGVVYVFVRLPSGEGVQTVTTPALLAVGPTFLLTLWGQRPPFMAKYLEGTIDYNTGFRSQMLLKLWASVCNTYQLSITGIQKQVRATLADLGHIANRDIVSLVKFEGILNDFLAGLVPMTAELGKVVGGKHIKTYDEDKDLYEDVLLQSGQLVESAKALLKTVGNYRDAYSVIINNNLNRVVKLLTIATVILTFPMTVYSFYGMNIKLPLDTDPLAWAFILTGTLALSIVMVALFIRNRWF
jgi:magnesium transporter